MSQYAKKKLGADDIRRALNEVRAVCFSSDQKLRLQQASFLPLPLGVDARNGKLLEWVSAYLSIELIYAGVTQKDCCAVGGAPRRTAGGCFAGPCVGCEPPESLIPFLYSLQPGGFKVPVTQSVCRPGELVFASGRAIPNPNVVCKKRKWKGGSGRILECSYRPRIPELPVGLGVLKDWSRPSTAQACGAEAAPDNVCYVGSGEAFGPR